MISNVSPTERAIRITLGVALLSCVFIFSSQLRWFGLFGLVPLVTGLIGWCPLYLLLSRITLD